MLDTCGHNTVNEKNVNYVPSVPAYVPYVPALSKEKILYLSLYSMNITFILLFYSVSGAVEEVTLPSR